VSGEGDLAYGVSARAMTLQGMPEDRGKQLVVFRRTADGWRVAAGAFNSDLPLPGPQAAPAR
jgi:ketosteroid isomerase-like protein